MTAQVIGFGAVSSIGLDAASTAAAQRAGVAGHAAHPFMIDRAGQPMVVNRVPLGTEDMDGMARMIELAVPAARQALSAVPADRKVDIFLALPEPRPGLPDGFAATIGGALATALGGDVTLDIVNVSPNGHASGLTLLGKANAWLARNRDALLLVGGVDSWLVPETLEWLDAIEALHSPEMPWGFTPGEAAGFCLLSGDDRWDAPLSIIAGGVGVEPNRIRTETVCTGTGLSSAWRATLADLDGIRALVDQIWSDLNGEPYRGDEIGFAVLRAREYLAEGLTFITPADCWGDIGAATGVLMVVAAAEAARKGYGFGRMSLMSCSSDGSSRASLLLHSHAPMAGARS